jgi:RNA polymerase sigma-70 factor, ECF subfamily
VPSRSQGRLILAGVTGPGALSHSGRLRVLEGVRSEDAAFERMYAAYHSRVYAFLHRLAGTRDGADDLFQETWLRVARSWAERGRADIDDEEAWLFTVARNAFLSERRAHSVKARGAEELRLVPPAPGPSPERAAQERQDVAALDAALAALSDDDRTLLWLVAAEGLEQHQIARVLGIGYAAVRQRLARARDRLAEHLDHARADGAGTPSRRANQP